MRDCLKQNIKCRMFKLLFTGRQGRWGRLETTKIGIRGMTCKRCERTIKKALLTKSGVREVYVNRVTGVATVSFDPAQTDIPQLTEVILRKGYVPGPVEEKAEAAPAG
jgi:copper chaperone CopZ